MKTITLFRPVGQKELELIRESGYTRFPPRLDWQPIFYPVMNEAYAAQIASEWNTKDEFSGYAGYVLAFDMPASITDQYPVQNVGGELHNELWVPAGELEAFNAAIIGEIRLVRSYFGENHKEV
ncbi:MAG: ADP-ribosylation/crystallin J1 [Bacteroidetes bacterium]|nr:ADP-ribosylation/crystallin J1 [Bacteroidota bacterium]